MLAHRLVALGVMESDAFGWALWETTHTVLATDGQTLVVRSTTSKNDLRGGLIYYYRMRLLDLLTGKETIKLERNPNFKQNPGEASAAAFSPDGKLLGIATRAGVGLWDTATGKERGFLKGPVASPSRLAFSTDGTTLALVSLESNQIAITVWDVASGKERLSVRRLVRGYWQVGGIALSPNDRLLAWPIGPPLERYVSLEKDVYLWEVPPPQQ
jgi:WD40 repeat protein